jgi:hypothetical protein
LSARAGGRGHGTSREAGLARVAWAVAVITVASASVGCKAGAPSDSHPSARTIAPLPPAPKGSVAVAADGEPQVRVVAVRVLQSAKPADRPLLASAGLDEYASVRVELDAAGSSLRPPMGRYWAVELEVTTARDARWTGSLRPRLVDDHGDAHASCVECDGLVPSIRRARRFEPRQPVQREEYVFDLPLHRVPKSFANAGSESTHAFGERPIELPTEALHASARAVLGTIKR